MTKITAHKSFCTILKFTDKHNHPLSFEDVCCDLLFFTRPDQPNFMASLRPGHHGNRNCELLPDGSLMVYFDNPSLAPGPLKGSMIVHSASPIYKQAFNTPVDIVPDRPFDCIPHHHHHAMPCHENHHVPVPEDDFYNNPVIVNVQINLSHPDFKAKVSPREMKDFVSAKIKESSLAIISRIDSDAEHTAEGMDALQKNIEGVVSEMEDLKNSVEENFKNLNDELKELASSNASDMNNLKDELNSLIEESNSSNSQSLQETKEALEALIEESNTSNSQSLQETKESLEALIEESNSSNSKALQDTKESLEALITEAGKSNSGALDELKQQLESKLDEAESKHDKDIENLKSDLQSAKNDLEEKITQESNRAKVAENALADDFNSLRTAVKSQVNTILQSVKENAATASNAVQAETSRAQLVEKDLADSLQRLKQSVAEGSVSYGQALDEAKEDLKAFVNYRIKELVGTAPEALDTLEEIAARLSSDTDAINVIKGILAEKANAEDVYKKEKIDALLEQINNTIAQERNRVNSEISNAVALVNEEKQRASLAEQANASAIDIINGDVDTPGSIKHAVADTKHYVDDKIHDLDDKVAEDISALVKSHKYVSPETVRSWFE